MMDLMIAAGWQRKNDLTAIDFIGNSAVTVILLGSYVPSPRQGNTKAPGHPGDIFYVDDITGEGINAIGLRDSWGIDGLREHLREMKRRARALGRRLRVSFAGFAAEDFANFMAMIYSLPEEDRPDEIEINYGCPNAAGHGIISYNAALVAECNQAILEMMPSKKVISTDLKFSPILYAMRAVYRNPNDLRRELSQTIVPSFDRSRGFRAVVTTNTIPNVEMHDPEGHPRIAALIQDGPQAGTVTHRGGQSGGDTMAKLSRLEAKHWDVVLPPPLRLVLVGGISSYHTALSAIEAVEHQDRIVGLQVGTAFFHHENKQVLHDVGMAIADWP